MIVCPSCGQENPDGFRLCGMCGAPLAVAAPSREERKVVTVLFADLVGSTSRAEGLDPEDVRAILSPFYARLRSELERFGGTVEKFIGDAVMAVFGAPTAHEDDPERGVRAALAIRDWVLEEQELQVRIAVHTGEALVALGARPVEGEGMVAGDVVNTAARVQSAAPVNGVLVGEQTYRATERAIEYREHEPVQAKGKAEPVAVWEAVQARARYGTDVRQVGGTALVGRAEELDVLRDALGRTCREREPQLVTLVGVPGIGKSRLLWELFEHVDAGSELVIWRQGRSLPYGEGISYWALGEIVKAQAAILETDGPDAGAAKLGETVAELLADPAERQWVESHLRPLVGLGADAELGGDRRGESFAAWRRFFEALADRHPVVLVFEDLHWADDGLLDFVDHLVEWIRGAPLLVAATARPELLERRPGWGGGKPNAITISLAPLSDDDTARIVHTLLDRSVLPAGVQASLLERAGGNPLYAEEFARLFEQRREGGAALPESVQGIIAARIDALSAEEKELLQGAAVLGKVFWLGALASLSRVARWTVEERLHSLERKEFVRRERRASVAGEVEYAFRHALVREVAYDQIARARRAETHRLAAEWIDSLGRPEDHAEMLAHHYSAALELSAVAGLETATFVEPAHRALREAGDRAFALNAFAQAARFYEDALNLSFDPELRLRHGHAVFLTGGERPEEILERAGEELLAAGNRERAAEANALLAELWWHRGSRERSFAYQRRAVELIGDAPASAAKARVLSEAGRAHVLAGDVAAGLPIAREAYEMADRLGLTELAARSLNTIGVTCDRIADVERSLDLALSVNSPEAGRCYNNLGALTWDTGDVRRAKELFTEAVHTGERLGNTTIARYSRGVLVNLEWSTGDWGAAARLADEFIAACERSPHYMESKAHEVRTVLALARGESEELVLAELQATLDGAREVADPQMLVPALGLASRVYAAFGRGDDARRALGELLAFAAQTEIVAGRPGYLLPAAFAAAAVGRADELRTLVEGAAPGRWQDVLLEVLDGDWERAVGLFDGTGHVPAAMEARLRAAEQLLAEGRRAEAEPHLQSALAFYRSVGATRYIREGEALLAATA